MCSEYTQSEYTDLSEYISMDSQADYKYSSEYTQDSQAEYKYSTEYTQDSQGNLDSYEIGCDLADEVEASYRLCTGTL